MRVYKVLDKKGRPHYGGRGSWGLPSGKRPGKWMHVGGRIVPCQNGLHLCRREDLIHWLGPTIYEAEFRGEPVVHENKIVVADARLLRRLDTWNERTARLFAADCASYAVRRCRKAGIAVDPRVTECIRVVYRYARGGATEQERSAAQLAADSAAWSAADSAAESAAWSAAESAAWLAAQSAADSAAWSAADSAVWLAAQSAADSAAWSAAGIWQTKRLFEYLDGKRS